jgi:predicted DsbA family dithiol-disulfide isomerase
MFAGRDAAVDAMTDKPALETVRLDIISDAICPWCYIGKRQVERALPLLAADGLRLDVQWHAFQLNPDMPPSGLDRAEYRRTKFGSAEAGREADARVAAAAADVGLEIHHEKMRRTPNTVMAHRVIWLAGKHGVQDSVVEALFAAYFTWGRDIGDPAELIDIAGAAGLAPGLVRALLDTEDGRHEVLSEDAMARNAGLDGVPCFTMEGHVLFSGAVPADAMAEAFARAWRLLGKTAAYTVSA